MPDKLEQLISRVYKIWKSKQPVPGDYHPDEEDISCLLEGKLPYVEAERIKLHLAGCDKCAELFILPSILGDAEEKDVPQGLLAKAKDLVQNAGDNSILEIILKLRENFLQLVNTTGDILVGREFVPTPVLRSRNIGDFKDEIFILKDFRNVRVEVKIGSKNGRSFILSVGVKEKSTQKPARGLRITLLKEGIELESYQAESGKALFENVLLGKYSVVIARAEEKIAGISLDIGE
ncbi:MAG: zf-HC2 domain-containing protein [Candidatus Omnitrophica bacterium]|nr:zf-HC2 domain-containing protein [Candidatus Omnitrophota bacterium]